MSEQDLEDTHRSHIRVRYAETDAMGVAHHAAYLVWFEVGRTDYMASRGLPYRECEARGIHLPVSEASCRYLSPLRFADELRLHTRLVEMRSRSLELSYLLYDGQGRLAASGRTLHVCTDAEGRARRIPEWMREAFFPTDGARSSTRRRALEER